MKKFFSFLKKTWWLLAILFSPPIIVIAVFAFGEYCHHAINMSAGEWSSLLSGAFGYWGTVILGVLAFWQNQQSQENNDVLMRYEQSRMAPVFSVKVQSYNGRNDLTVLITNITDNIACTISFSNLKMVLPNKTTQECPVTSTVSKDYLNGNDSIEVKYETPAVYLRANEEVSFLFDIISTDIVGNRKTTTVCLKTGTDFRFKISYSAN